MVATVTRFVQLLLGVGLWLGLHYGAVACDGSGTGGSSADATVVLEGSVSDEAATNLVATTPVADPSQEAFLTSPSTGQVWGATSAQLFGWRVGEVAALEGTMVHRFASSRRAASRQPTRESLGFLLVAAAQAHGAPVFGRAYLLVVKDPHDRIVHQAFTLDLEHLPSDSRWEDLVKADQPLQASVLSAVFDNNAIASGGGPWQGPTVSFTLE